MKVEVQQQQQQEEEEEELGLEPMSPSAQYLKSSVLSLTILGVLECQGPIDDSLAISLVKDVFLPINPRFSSIMVAGKKGVKKWKKVEVHVEEHVKVPIFPDGMAAEYYDDCFADYLSNLSTEQLPPSRPLWEIHIVKYPTRHAAGNLIFKLHHSLGDGYSLMGALLSCLQRLDNPLLPLTFPSRQSAADADRRKSVLRRVPRLFSGIWHTVYDFGWSLLKSSLNEDDKSPIRSGEDAVELRPIATATTTFSIDQIKQIKNKLNVTINDVITGIIIFGTRLYMQKTSEGSGNSKSTALVLLNTRAIGGYRSVDEMVRPDSDMPWGNRFTFLPVPLPKLTPEEIQNPLVFVKKSHRIIKRQRNSGSVFLTGQLLNIISKFKGPEATAKYIHGTLKNTSMAISNLIGPVEQMALANQPVKGLYFIVAGPPQSLSVTMISYVGKLRIALNMEKGFMDPNKFKSCIEYAFDAISKAALLQS
ncbi:wax ester synthase/diacylglycerol acyltransferase 4-like [Andrographis paniculata]|uniref:wax ester synthase/diacylglycerol acyltransferase 4-like n=1 Tax=Andrographis paniculata TaxID=175694 RepID=UPI0021E7DA69|nr:wax ester synthase/diacylglycerol acyltransferase 4-like [Andrographis paniculata]